MDISSMEPMLPSDGNRRLEDLVAELIEKASRFAARLNLVLHRELGDLVRSMNCYYSNLIEGHNTHPVDINRALRGDYSGDTKKRNLQLEARAHIEVQMSMAETNCARRRRKSVPVWLIKKGGEALGSVCLV